MFSAIRFIVASSALALCVTGVARGAYIQTFDSNNAGFATGQMTNLSQQSAAPSVWSATGGNAGGFISAPVTAIEPRVYVFGTYNVAPYGDMTGQSLTVDFKYDGQTTSPTAPYVRFYLGSYTGGSNYFVTKDAYAWNPNGQTNWTTHLVELIAANFQTWPNIDTGDKTFAEVIAAPEDIGVVFANGFTSAANLGFAGTGTIGIDNFGTVVPEPGTLSLLGLGSLLALKRRRA